MFPFLFIIVELERSVSSKLVDVFSTKFKSSLVSSNVLLLIVPSLSITAYLLGVLFRSDTSVVFNIAPWISPAVVIDTLDPTFKLPLNVPPVNNK